MNDEQMIKIAGLARQQMVATLKMMEVEEDAATMSGFAVVPADDDGETEDGDWVLVFHAVAVPGKGLDRKFGCASLSQRAVLTLACETYEEAVAALCDDSITKTLS